MILRLFRAMMPKEEAFVERFTDHADRLVAAADALIAVMDAPPEARAARAAALADIESQADAITRDTIVALHRAFITPFDRSDIHALANGLDDAVDLIEEVVQHAALYRVDSYCQRMRDLAVAIRRCAGLLAEVMPQLAAIGRNAQRINSLCDQVGAVESEADRLLQVGLSDLVAARPDTIEFIGRKEVFERLEAVTDLCADVADIIEGIVLDQV